MNNNETSADPRWNDQDTASFLDDGAYFIPDREMQLSYFCRLIPRASGSMNIVELGCGEGLLAAALLESLPGSVVHGYDGSPMMLEKASAALNRFGPRFRAHEFELRDRDWRKFPFPVHAFVSSLVIHHLEAAAKRELFCDLASALSPGGVLLIADLTMPRSNLGLHLAADAWDEAVRERSLRMAQDLGPFERFTAADWNYYRHPDDPVDMPSPLYDQLTWMTEAGFTDVDVFWMRAGHALFGGRRSDR